MRRMVDGLVVVAGLVVVLAACGSETTSGVDVTGTWVLASGSGPDGVIEVPDGARVDLRFEDGQVGGTAACNQYFAEVEVDGTSLTVAGIGQTEMGCDEPRMATESAYLGALARVTTITRDGDVLTLTGEGVELVFELEPPEPDAALVGTTWTLDTIVSADAASTVLGDTATLVLAEDGSFRAGTGCRQAVGQWSRDGGRVATTDVAVDDVVCDEALSSQDAHVLAVLEDGFTATIEGQRLTLSAGARGLGYSAPPA